MHDVQWGPQLVRDARRPTGRAHRVVRAVDSDNDGIYAVFHDVSPFSGQRRQIARQQIWRASAIESASGRVVSMG